MMRVLYATTNPGKLFEVGKFLNPFGIELLGPKDLGLSIDVSEEGNTLEENALLKARAYIDEGIEYPVLADDTGIEIDALDGEPVHIFFLLVAPQDSAGPHLKALARISRLLKDKYFRDNLRQAKDDKTIIKIITQEDEKRI